MLGKKSIFIFYCVVLTSVLAVGTATRSNYDSRAVPENGTCYKRVPYDEAVIANLSKGLIKTESTTPPPGIETWITIIDCCDGYRRDEYTGNCEFYCEEGCYGGNCTGPNECTCEDGWRAERGECRPLCRQRCPRNAYCFSPNVCTCLFGFEEIDGVCQPICEHNCRNGDCVAPADCRCHRGYFLNDTRHCEPICESGCQHGFCTAPGVCACDQGYVNQLYDSESCVPECPAECINGECVTPNVCTCKAGYQQNDNGTCEAQCEETCPENGLCIAPNQCGCNTGFILDAQKKKCIELPKNTQTNQTYQNRGVFPSRNNHGQLYHQEPKQVYGVNNAYNPQQNKSYGNVDRTHGTQRPSYNRANNPDDQGGVYQTDNPYGISQTENPQEVVGLQDRITTQNPREGVYGNYGGNQTPRPQRPFTQQGTYGTSTPYPTLGIRGGVSGSTTNRTPVNNTRYIPQGPLAPLEPHSTQILNQGSNGTTYTGQQYHFGNRGNRPANGSLQGPFAPQSPQIHHTTQSSIQPDEPRQTDRPYRPHDFQTQSPWSINQNRNPYDRTNPNGQRTSNDYPNQHQNPYGETDSNGQQMPSNYPNQHQNPYDQHRPSQGVNRPYNPYSPTNSHDQEGVKTGQRRPSNEPQLPYSSHRPYNPYGPTNPSETQGVKTSYGRPPYSSSGVVQTYNPYTPNSPYNPRTSQDGSLYTPVNPRETLGFKTAQRPSTDIYSRSSIMQSNPQAGIDFSYGIDHLSQVPASARPFNGQKPSPIPERFIVSDPYVQPGSGNIGGIIIIDSPQVPSVNQFQSLCNGPCINSHCIGLNLCMCEIGFIPDPRNPNGNVCVPV